MNRRRFLRGIFGGLLVTSPFAAILIKLGMSPYAFKQPTTLAEELISIQPMTGPVGEIFNMRHVPGSVSPFKDEVRKQDCWGQHNRGEHDV